MRRRWPAQPYFAVTIYSSALRERSAKDHLKIALTLILISALSSRASGSVIKKALGPPVDKIQISNTLTCLFKDLSDFVIFTQKREPIPWTHLFPL